MKFHITCGTKHAADAALVVSEIGDDDRRRLANIELEIVRRLTVIETSARIDGKQTITFDRLRVDDVRTVLAGFCITAMEDPRPHDRVRVIGTSSMVGKTGKVMSVRRGDVSDLRVVVDIDEPDGLDPVWTFRSTELEIIEQGA